MNSDMAKRSHAVFTRALDLDDRDRDEFIAAQCAGDPMLRAHVAKMLSAASKSGAFLEKPALSPSRIMQRGGTPVLPERIGDYRIVRVLGTGGMATVYEAEQQQPRRTVALKIMRRALAHTSAQQRFRFETEVLAKLQHPGIAQIYEAGTFDESPGVSLPYFAMEYIPDATTITAYAKSHSLSIRDRLLLFLNVCDAVQHGHQLGVVHRDLKPGNILVQGSQSWVQESAKASPTSPLNPEPLPLNPKIIDFGVARSTDPSQAGITQDSDTGRIIGTLNAMSPEQCVGGQIDARTDVYALGVVLYELISGRLPHDLNGVAIPEAIRIITQETPRALSRLVPDARGDLDAIVSMALEKEPARRYASVNALAADIRRFLNDQPIDARPATTIYQLRKFARRNRVMVGAVAAVLLTLAGGIVATARMAILEENARRVAETSNRQLTEVLAFQEAQLAKMDVVSVGQGMREALASAIAAAAKDRQTGDQARAEFDRITGEVNFTTLALRALDDAVLQRTLDAIHRDVATDTLVQAALLQRHAQTLHSLGLGPRALAPAEDALRIRRRILGEDHVETLEAAFLRGTILSMLGRLDESIAVLRDVLERSTRTLGPDSDKTLTTARSLAGALQRSGDLTGAELLFRDTLERQRRIGGPDAPAALRTLNNLAIVHANRGELDIAEAQWREVLERRIRTSGPDHPDLQTPRVNLGLLLQDQGRLDEARLMLEDHLAAMRRQHGDDHEDTLSAISYLAVLRLKLNDWEAAERLQSEGVERSVRTLGANDARTLRAKAMLAAVYVEFDRLNEAELILCDVLAAQRAHPRGDKPDVIDTLTILSDALRGQGRLEEAEAWASDALATARRFHRGNHPAIAASLLCLGHALAADGRFTEATPIVAEAHRMFAALHGPQHPDTLLAARAHAELDPAAGAVQPHRENRSSP